MSLFHSAVAGALALTSAAADKQTVAPPPPPYAGVYQPQGVDEIGMWREDDESERKLAASALVIRDEKLNAYVRNVLCETVGADRCRSVRIYIMREPTINASMSPNGTLRIFSGFLLRLRNEAELGAILGHEFGHYEKRHTLNRFKAARSGTDLLAWTALLASMAPSYDARRSYNDLELSVYGSLYRFSRDNEREADFLGISYLNRSLLRPQAAASVFQGLMGEFEASARAKGLKKPNFSKIAFAASHPPDAERAAYLTLLAAPAGASRDNGADRYRGALAPWLPAFLSDQIKLNDFGASEYIINSLAASGWTPTLWMARGDLYRLRGNPRDLVNAAEFYEAAVQLDPTLADAYRGLGLSLIKTGRPSDGQAALRKYLELKPDAADRAFIQMMLPVQGVGQ
ncbi:M48 family metallopeptidase [Sphingomonas turrisvirgatae]|uniref:Peptidase M48 n=1 Tax=Sphingomonas turrisvirgatae TaxID=1888892 RepID=A0A1E3LTF3_9SPHN|nr:M48 family metallopeptidase [Sphingomonas turrisvirgatae]ODP37009.1 peptidase M48 [Sphingomonas turrisvirgatae]